MFDSIFLVDADIVDPHVFYGRIQQRLLRCESPESLNACGKVDADMKDFISNMNSLFSVLGAPTMTQSIEWRCGVKI
jgi:hypothetical protein